MRHFRTKTSTDFFPKYTVINNYIIFFHHSFALFITITFFRTKAAKYIHTSISSLNLQKKRCTKNKEYNTSIKENCDNNVVSNDKYYMFVFVFVTYEKWV